MSEGSLELPLEAPKNPGGRRVVLPPKPVTQPSEDQSVAAGPPRVPVKGRLEPVSAYFLLAFVLGTAVAATGLANNALSHRASFLGPIMATLLYVVGGFFAGWSNRPKLREKFADNCYYLGFIFTQVSLVIGFAPIALFGRSISAEDVLRFFGTALGSSLIGLIARTVFTQVADTADVDDEVEELAKEVTRHSRLILEQFQSLLEGVGRGHEETVTSLQSTSTAIGRALKDFEATLARNTQHLVGAEQIVEKAASSLKTRAEEHEGDLARAVREAQVAISTLQTDLNRRVSVAASSIDQTAKAIGAAVTGIEEFPKLAPLLAKSEQSANAIEAELSSLKTTAAAAIEQVSQMSDELPQKFADVVDRAADRLETATASRVDGFETDLTAAVAAFDDTLRRFKAELERINVG